MPYVDSRTLKWLISNLGGWNTADCQIPPERRNDEAQQIRDEVSSLRDYLSNIEGQTEHLEHALPGMMIGCYHLLLKGGRVDERDELTDEFADLLDLFPEAQCEQISLKPGADGFVKVQVKDGGVIIQYSTTYRNDEICYIDLGY